MISLSASKIAEILAKVQLNPEILTDNQAFIEQRIDSAGQWLANAVGLRRYPELVQAYSKSKTGASTDITGLSTNELQISIDGDSWYTLEVTLAGANTGALIAAELQTQIRAIDSGSYKFATVVFADTVYTITSPTYGEGSIVTVYGEPDQEELAQDLGLSPNYGGTEVDGGEFLPLYDDMTVRLMQHWFNQIGVEGMKSHSLQGSGSYTEHEIDPVVARFIVDNRRIIR
mgnify:CR=1 FL=1